MNSKFANLIYMENKTVQGFFSRKSKGVGSPRPKKPISVSVSMKI